MYRDLVLSYVKAFKDSGIKKSDIINKDGSLNTFGSFLFIIIGIKFYYDLCKVMMYDLLHFLESIHNG